MSDFVESATPLIGSDSVHRASKTGHSYGESSRFMEWATGIEPTDYFPKSSHAMPPLRVGMNREFRAEGKESESEVENEVQRSALKE